MLIWHVLYVCGSDYYYQIQKNTVNITLWSFFRTNILIPKQIVVTYSVIKIYN